MRGKTYKLFFFLFSDEMRNLQEHCSRDLSQKDIRHVCEGFERKETCCLPELSEIASNKERYFGKIIIMPP